jgi:hypothetical protein
MKAFYDAVERRAFEKLSHLPTLAFYLAKWRKEAKHGNEKDKEGGESR